MFGSYWRVSSHHMGKLEVCLLRAEVLQNLLVVAAVDVVAVDLQDDLPGLKPRPCRLPACVECQREGSKGRSVELKKKKKKKACTCNLKLLDDHRK